MVVRKQRKKAHGVEKVINGKTYRLPSSADKMRRSPMTVPSSTEDNGSSDLTLCFFLGMFLGPFGMLISAVVAKGPGVWASIKGLFIGLLVVGLIILISMMLSLVH